MLKISKLINFFKNIENFSTKYVKYFVVYNNLLKKKETNYNIDYYIYFNQSVASIFLRLKLVKFYK